jgi:hypothetical protein
MASPIGLDWYTKVVAIQTLDEQLYKKMQEG